MLFRDVVGGRYILARFPPTPTTTTATTIVSSGAALRTRSPLPPSLSSRSSFFTLANLPTPRALRPNMVTTNRQRHRDHMGHSHSHEHHHHHDKTYLLSKNRTDPGVRITRIGLYVNLLMAVSKGVGGWYFNSQALVADAFHALTDLVSDFMTLGTVALALKPPSAQFPNGYGKIESLGSLAVSSLLLFGGVAMGYTALAHLCGDFLSLPGFLHHSHSHTHSHGDLGPNINAAWLAAGSIVVKEWLYRATIKIAREKKSPLLASNAIHHRVDSLTSLVALGAIGGAHVLQNAAYLDSIGGLLVSVMVVNAGFSNTRSAVLELLDVGLEREVKDSVRGAAEKVLALRGEGLVVAQVGGFKSGQNYLVEVTVRVPSGMAVGASAGVEEVVREAVGAEVRGVKRVKVRFVEEGREVPSEFVDTAGEAREEHKL